MARRASGRPRSKHNPKPASRQIPLDRGYPRYRPPLKNSPAGFLRARILPKIRFNKQRLQNRRRNRIPSLKRLMPALSSSDRSLSKAMAILSPTGMQSPVPAKKMPRSNTAYGRPAPRSRWASMGNSKRDIGSKNKNSIADQLSKLEQAINEAEAEDEEEDADLDIADHLKRGEP